MTRVIKRYSNRKLYDTQDSHYVGLQDILNYIRDDEDIEVVDSATSEDLTSVTLAQAMTDEEKSEGDSLPLDVIKELIKRGSESLNEMMRISRLLGKGAFQIAEESATKNFRKLVERGEMTADEADNFLKHLSREATDRRRSLEKTIDRRVKAYIKATGLPSGSDFDRISKKIDAIVEKLDAYLSDTDMGKPKSRKGR